MLYGENDGNTIIFQIRGDRLSKIIVQHGLKTKNKLDSLRKRWYHCFDA